MKRIFYLSVFLISLVSFSQEIKLKKGVVLVDDVEWLNYNDCGTFDSTCSLLNKQKEELIFIKTISLNGVEPMTSSNPRGVFSYYEVVFVGTKMKTEFQKRQKAIIEILYNAKVVNEDGTLNNEKIERLVEKYGTPFSDRFNRSNSNQTIIINNNQTPQNSGVNINLGK
jgi:hypothetical protein